MTRMSRRLPALALALSLACVAPFGAQAQQGGAPSPTYQAEVSKLMELAGMDAIMSQMLSQMATMMRPVMMKAMREEAQAAGETWDEAAASRFYDRFMREFEKEMDGLDPIIAEVYAQHFSLQEIRHINRLYSDPVVQRMVDKQPQLMGQMQKRAARWGQEAAGRAFDRTAEALGPPSN
jgi:hypothetical protein